MEAECLLDSHHVQHVERWGWGLGSALIQGRAPYNFPTYRMGAYFEVGVYSNVYGIIVATHGKDKIYNINYICALVDTRVSKGMPKFDNGPRFFIIKDQRGKLM